MPKSKILVEDDDRPAHVSVVYNPKDGKVVHVHEFFGKTFNPDECAQIALDTVTSVGRVKAGELKVLHTRELKLGANTILRVNTKSLQIDVKELPLERSRDQRGKSAAKL